MASNYLSLSSLLSVSTLQFSLVSIYLLHQPVYLFDIVLFIFTAICFDFVLVFVCLFVFFLSFFVFSFLFCFAFCCWYYVLFIIYC